MLDRRQMVTALAGAAGLAAPAWLHAERMGRALRTVGLQLYTVRGEMQRDLEGTLARVAEIGYREVEFAGYFGRTPAQVRRSLRSAGLTAPSTHVGPELLGERWAPTLDEARTIGHRWVTIAAIPAEQRRTLDAWRRWADAFSAAGAAARQVGLRFAYHNHAIELLPVEGVRPLDLLLERTDPAFVDIELDLFWCVQGGGDPLDFFQRHPGRFAFVHVKDRTAEGRMADVGAGTLDFRALLRGHREAGIQAFFVEHDEPADPWASIRASYAHLRRLDI
jgi:sugar phosphate isomerase/epimerase